MILVNFIFYYQINVVIGGTMCAAADSQNSERGGQDTWHFYTYF